MELSRRTTSVPTREEAILSTALDLFFERGFHACSLRDLAAALGITVGTVYHYFESKDQILFRLQHDGLERLLQRAHRVLESAAGASVTLTLRALIEAHFLYHMEHTKSARLHTAEFRSLEPRSRAIIRDQMKRYERIFTTLVEEGVRRGEFSPDAGKITAFVMIGAGGQISNWYRDDGDLTREQIVAVAVNLFLNGLLPESHELRATAGKDATE
ncbi:hypothetical protein AYO38_03160 [bacterium SCGC AG-212-C10]|nr:hypothetical protein AYO38_03160 [bacterium SCGC AG-212-C10]